MTDQTKVRCAWAESNELLMAYHDTEWGIPAHDDRCLFEMLNLEGAQAGLSWLTVLRKRENYRQAFDYFDAEKIANYDDKKKQALLQNEGIIRNRLKINAVVENARAFLEVQREFGSFDTYIWSFVDGKPMTDAQEQQATAKSVLMSKSLSKRGFRFVGPTICYAFMQAVGMVNDHTSDCFRASMIANEGLE
ncbi:MAG TPA: DNA-3-methyladenine glycosylase I [Ktedonobacteraceae bacterium]|jgi:DNA-3-methyladenine glycosylase I